MPLAYACDPGITTGFSIGVVTPEVFLITCQEGKLSHGQIFNKLRTLNPNFIISESFEFRGKARDNVELFSREIIGVLRLWAEISGDKMVLQPASEGKGYFTDDKLKALDVYNKSTKHGRDAVRHLLHWWMFKGGFEFNKEQKIVLVTEEYLNEEGYLA